MVLLLLEFVLFDPLYRTKGKYTPVCTIKPVEPLPKIKHAVKITKNRLNQYHLHVPLDIVPVSENQAKGKIISLDPGVRTFQTGYDPAGKVIEFGGGCDRDKLLNLHQRIDRLQSAKKLGPLFIHHPNPNIFLYLGNNSKTRYHLQKKILTLYQRIKNMVRDSHCKIAKYLCSHYETVIIPEFHTSSMIKKEKRILSKASTRQTLIWSHYKFRNRLVQKSREYKTKVIIVNEEYTSKTCGLCGVLNKKLGDSKIFTCPSCKYTIDRDINGARNILIKTLSR